MNDSVVKIPKEYTTKEQAVAFMKKEHGKHCSYTLVSDGGTWIARITIK